MMKRLLALLLVVSLIASMCTTAFAGQWDTTATPEDDTIKYVSLGDSMSNGYGLKGYDGDTGVWDYGEDAYANQFVDWLEDVSGKRVNHEPLAMSAMRAEDLHWMLELDYENDDVRELVDRDAEWSEVEEEWYAMFTTGDKWTWDQLVDDYRLARAKAYIEANGNPSNAYDKDTVEEAVFVAEYYQNAVAEADIISLGMGNGNFGVFLLHRMLDVIGFSGGGAEAAMQYRVERALAEFEPEMQGLLLTLLDELYVAAEDYIVSIAGELPEEELDAMVNIVTYTGISFVLNYAGAVEAIVSLNPDAEIILMPLMNTFSDNGEASDELSLGMLMDTLFGYLNNFVAGLPTFMQTVGNEAYANATFYYADAKDVERVAQTYKTDLRNGQVRARFVKSIVGENGDGMVWGLLAPMVPSIVPNAQLKVITLADIEAYEAMSDEQKAMFAAMNSDMAISCSLYLAFEDAVIEAAVTGSPINLKSIMGLGGLNAGIFANVMQNFSANIGANGAAYFDAACKAMADIVNAKAEAMGQSLNIDATTIKMIYLNNPTGDSTVAAISNLLTMFGVDVKGSVDMLCMLLALPETLSAALQSDDNVFGLLNMFALCLIGDGLGVHPSAGGHTTLAEAVKKAYADEDTAADKTEENLWHTFHADYTITSDSYYVAIDGLYAKEHGYADKLASELNIPYAKIAELDEAEIAKADLITVRYNNEPMIGQMVKDAKNYKKVQPKDWTAYVGEEGAAYIQEALLKVEAKLAEQNMGALHDMAMVAIESYAYECTGHMIGYIKDMKMITAINPDALIVSVGMNNALEDAVLVMDGQELALGKYINYVIEAANMEAYAYVLLTGDAIYVNAPDVATDFDATVNKSAMDFILALIDEDDRAVLKANEEGHAYIAEQILNALTVSVYEPEEPEIPVLKGDLDKNGNVDIDDVLLCLDLCFVTPSVEDYAVADLDVDGDIDIDDVLLCLDLCF